MNKKKSAFKCLALVTAIAALQGCGGGGGDGFAFPFPLQTDGAAKDPGTQVAEPTPSPDPGTDSAIDPTACITAPQPGSTAAVGNEIEGMWRRKQTGLGFMMIDSSLNSVGWTYGGEPGGNFDGTMSYSASNGSWQFDSGVTSAYAAQWSPLTGQGTFTPKSTISGTYSTDSTGAQSTFGPWFYDVPTNSLALSQDMLQGTWGFSENNIVMSIEVGPDGSFTGSSPASSTLGACAFTGTVQLREPGTKKNSLKFAMTSANTAQSGERACIHGTYPDGVGAVMVNQDTSSGSCKQSLSIRIFFKDATGRNAGNTSLIRQ